MTTKDYLRALYFRAIDMGYQKHELKFEISVDIFEKITGEIILEEFDPIGITLFGVPVEINHTEQNKAVLWGVIDP